MEKQGEVAILQTMGLKRSQIMSIFMLQCRCRYFRAVAGGLLGALLSSQLNVIMPAGTHPSRCGNYPQHVIGDVSL